MQQRIRTLLLLAFCCAFLAPGVLALWGVRWEGLAGEEHRKKPVAQNLKNVTNQKWQRYAEETFQRRSGVFDALVKTDNQLNYFLFNSISSNPHATVILGEQGHLIEHLYLRDANRIKLPQSKTLRGVVKKLKALQDVLKAQGIDFVLVISPNKPSFYPKIIPRRYKIEGVEQRFNIRAYMTEKLQRQGVRFIDGYELLKRKESELGVPMFSPIGTHWNEVGGCLIASEILKQSEHSNNRAQFECVVGGSHDRPAYHDSDLLRLANLWYETPFLQPAPRVEIVKSKQKMKEPWRILTVGSSFCWELMRQFENSGAVSQQEFLYYFHRRSKRASSRGVNFDSGRYDAGKELKGRDIVVIEINQAVLQKAGFGFPESVLRQMRAKL
jgi:hypothetical protein